MNTADEHEKMECRAGLAAPTGMRVRLIALSLVAMSTAWGLPGPFVSGPAQVPLVELYTSEGCSSCPPAEAWMNRLQSEPGLWRDFVPVSFHVNYWDRLGWPDRFASRAFTERQYAYAKDWRAGTVYTPGFVLNGRDWRDRARTLPALGKETGTLTVELTAEKVRVAWQPLAQNQQDYEVHAALLGGGIVSKVKAGENRGETLAHEFVALSLVKHVLVDGHSEFPLSAVTQPGVTRRALAVWVTRRGELEPVQATGGWVD
jgi:hypothetical protein